MWHNHAFYYTFYPNLPIFLHRYICHICDILQLWLSLGNASQLWAYFGFPNHLTWTQVLSVGKALSIQAHPDLPHAQQLHRERPEVIFKKILCSSCAHATESQILRKILDVTGVQGPQPQARDCHRPDWLWRIVRIQTAPRNPGLPSQVIFDIYIFIITISSFDHIIQSQCARAGSSGGWTWESVGHCTWNPIQVQTSIKPG